MLLNRFRGSLLRQTASGLRALAPQGQCKNRLDHTTPQAATPNKDVRKIDGKAGYDFEYLFNLEKTNLVYKVIRLQRQVDSYVMMRSLKNVDGRDKIRVEHPDPEEIVDHYQSNIRRVAFKVMYIGWDYMAYAWSNNTDKKVVGHTNVVERVFLEALVRQQLVRRIGPRLRLDRAGRTDSGVSGLSQVICVDVRTNLDEGYGVWSMKQKMPVEGDRGTEETGNKPSRVHPGAVEHESVSGATETHEGAGSAVHKRFCYEEDPRFNVKDTSQDELELPYPALLNAALPPDIRVVAWSPVARYFSPRGACKGRTYRYFFPLGDLDIELMNQAAQKLVGSKDFRNFGKLSSDSMYSRTVREIHKFEIEVLKNRRDPALPECDVCAATVVGSGFMYRQVRLMLSILYSIGKGFEKPSLIDRLLDVDDSKGRPSYPSLSAVPLVLYDTEYDDNEICWRWDEESTYNAAKIMAETWCDTAMRAEVLRAMYSNMLGSLSSSDRNEAKKFVIDHLQSFDGAQDVKDIGSLELSSNVQEFQDSERRRSLRRLRKKGNYRLAAELEKDKDAKFGWKF